MKGRETPLSLLFLLSLARVKKACPDSVLFALVLATEEGFLEEYFF